MAQELGVKMSAGDEEQSGEQRKTEILAFCSGKGGTGKSLLCACFGYALLRAGQRVLMIDSDLATDGLSLFLMGPKGPEQIPSFEDQNTFIGALERFQKTGGARFEPREIHRRGDDHRVSYQAILSARDLYGEAAVEGIGSPASNQGNFRAAIRQLFSQLREAGEYDAVLVDTRSGFASESTDLCALADSFIVVTEPDYASFYQERNLVSRVAAAAREVGSPSRLRAIIVNKAVDAFPEEGKSYLDTLEAPFRSQLVKEFGLLSENVHAVPVSLEALLAYRAQKSPYRSAPESIFCKATLAAFTGILGISLWATEQVDRWNVLADSVERAGKEKQELEQKKEQARLAREEEFQRLQAATGENELKLAAVERNADQRLTMLQREYEARTAALEGELEHRTQLYERERARSEALLAPPAVQTGGDAGAYAEAAPSAGSQPEVPTAPADADGLQPLPAEEAEHATWQPSAEALAAFAQASVSRRELNVPALLVVLLVVGALAAYLLVQSRSRKVPTIASAVKPGEAAPGLDKSNSPSPLAAGGLAQDAGAKGDATAESHYAVLLAGGNALTATKPGAPSAAYEAHLALQAGYTVQIYQRNGRYTAAVPWNTQAQADEAMKAVQTPFNGRWARTSAVVSLGAWCPDRTAQEAVPINSKEVPVWSCLPSAPHALQSPTASLR